MTIIILIILLISAIVFGFLNMKYGDYISGKLAMKNDSEKAIILFKK